MLSELWKISKIDQVIQIVMENLNKGFLLYLQQQISFHVFIKNINNPNYRFLNLIQEIKNNALIVQIKEMNIDIQFQIENYGQLRISYLDSDSQNQYGKAASDALS